MLRSPLLAAVALGLLCGPGCAPNPTPPIRVMALIESSGAYSPQAVELSTLKDLTALNGDAVSFIGGAKITVDPDDPLLENAVTEDDLRRVFIKTAGGDVRGSYIEKDGIFWPADFHSWNMVSAYRHFERAYQYWQGVGMPDDEMKGTPVYYFPTFTLMQVSKQPLEDNAMFFSPLQAFLILPFKDLQDVPLAMNAGVIAHEFSHRVFNKRVYSGQSIPQPLALWALTGNGANVLKSLDEGLADYHAYGTSCESENGCDVRFLEGSLGVAAADARDLSRKDRCITTTLKDEVGNLRLDVFTQAGTEYEVGTIIASALYQAGEKSGRRRELQKAVLATYSDTKVTNPGLQQLIHDSIAKGAEYGYEFTLEKSLNALVAHITDPELKKQTCNELVGRLKLDLGQVLACNASTTTPVADCKTVP